MLLPEVRVFISSTFLDLQEERNALHVKVFPRMKQFCEDRGLSFFPVELRWGITDEEKKQGRVLSLCLSEIDKCRPFFIGIIGDRYGTVMSEIDDEIINEYPWLKGLVGRSLTEIEMYYGALSPDCPPSCSSFHIKSNAHAIEEKLIALKEAIESSNKLKKSLYTNLDEFVENVYLDLTNFVNSYYSNKDIINKQEWYNSELQRYYVANERFHKFLDNYYISEQTPLLLFGNSLAGKTTVLSNWALSKNSHAIIVNCNAEDKYRYWPNIAIRIMREIKEGFANIQYPDLNIPESLQTWIDSRDETIEKQRFSEDAFYNYIVTDEEVERFRKSFVDWFINLTISEEIIIVLNDLQLVRKWGETAFLGWLPNSAPNNIHVFASVNDSFTIDILERKGWGSVEFKGLSKDEEKRFIVNYLDYYGKRLSDSDMQSLSNANYFHLPGMVKFVSDYLISIANNENLGEYISNISTLNTGNELFAYVISSVCGDFDDEKEDMFKNLLSLLSISRFSLDEYEVLEMLKTICPVHSIEWEDVKLRSFPFLSVSYGKMQIVADVVNAYIIDALLTEEKSSLLHTIMGDFYFNKFDAFLTNDNLSELSMIEQIRICTDSAVEILHHYCLARNWDKLYGAVTDFPLLCFLAKVNWDTVLTSWIELITNTDYSLLTAYKDITLRCINLLCEDDGHEDFFHLYRKIIDMCDKFKFEEVARELDCASLLYDNVGSNMPPDVILKVLTKIAHNTRVDENQEIEKSIIQEGKKYKSLLEQTNILEANHQEIEALELIEANLSEFSTVRKAILLHSCIHLCHNLGFGKKYEVYTNELYDFSIKLADNFAFMLAIENRAHLAYNTGNHEEALVLYEKSKTACCINWKYIFILQHIE